MPAQSKQQQKFMGIVRAIQKGDQPASKFSKKAQDAADDMKKKDVEKFASTKHKGLPKKVEQALREKIKSMVEDYVESCGYVVSAKDPNYKLKSPGGTGEEDRELKEVHKMVGARGKMVVVPDNYAGRYGKVQYNLMKKLGYTGGDHNIIKSMDWGYKNYHRQKPNDQFSSSIILKSSPEKPFGDKDGRIRKKDVMRVITELMKQLKANKLKLDKKVVYRPDRNNPMIEFRVDPKSVVKESVNENTTYKVGDTISYWTIGRIDKGKAKVKGVTKARPNRLGIKNHYITNKGTFSDMEVMGTEAYKLRFKGNTEKKVMKAMGVKEGFGSDEFLTKTEKKKFEKERLENAEVLGYELTGVKDVNENINEKKKMFPPDKMTPKQAKEYKKFIDYAKMGIEYKIDMSLFESINEDGHTDVPSAVRKLKTSIEDALQIIGYLKKVNDAEPLPSWWTDKVTLSSNYLNTARNYILNPHESVFAVRQDKIKNGERFPKEPNFDYDPEKGKSRIRKVNESMSPSQIKKMRDEFEKTGDLPPHLKKLVKDLKIVKKKHKVKNIVVPGLEWMSDMKEQSVNESKEPEVITQLRDIVKRKQNKKIKDPKSKKTMRVDMFSASAITQVYDAIKKNSSYRKKFESLPLDKMAQLSFKMMRKGN